MINCYLSGNPVHDRVIKAFYEGCPEEKQLLNFDQYSPSDVAVVFGVYKSKIPASYQRGKVIQWQRQKNLDVVVLETGYINRGDGENHHYAAGLNGLNGRADFKNEGMPGDRAALLNVQLKPWRESGEHILLCGQIPWDASVDHIDFNEWLELTVRAINLYTSRRIVFRPHPLLKAVPIVNCDYSMETLEDDLKNCWAVVTFNSTTGVEAVINGIPVVVADNGSMAYPVATRALHNIEDPITPDRAQWLANIAYTQWTPAEMTEGKAWKHLFR